MTITLATTNRMVNPIQLIQRSIVIAQAEGTTRALKAQIIRKSGLQNMLKEIFHVLNNRVLVITSERKGMLMFKVACSFFFQYQPIGLQYS